MRYAYADPPYLGMCKRYDHHHPDGRCWDDVETHRLLIDRLGEYDGWALSLSTVSLAVILPMCPPRTRVLAYCKTWASWKPGVHPTFAWEPVLMHGQRKRERAEGIRWNVRTTPDWVATAAKNMGYFGNKPATFTHWLLACLGVQPEDEFHDLFPGSGAVTKAWESWRTQLRMLA